MNKYKEVHIPCPQCSSSDAFCTYLDKGGKCFSCGYVQPKGGVSTKTTFRTKRGISMDFLEGEAMAITTRKLTKELCSKWKYYKGQDCHIANFLDDKGKVIGQKIRKKGKKFLTIGKTKFLYGKWLYPSGGKYAVITEGELDAISINQVVQGHNYFCSMSLPNGVNNAREIIKQDLRWLEESFEKIILLFDNDEVGEEAANSVIDLFSPGKVCIGKLLLKDASDMLQKERIKELTGALFSAKNNPYKPDSILVGEELREYAYRNIETGLSLPWARLSAATYGFRMHEIWVLAAGTASGKTEVFKEFAYHCIQEHEGNVGIFFLEETPTMTTKSFMGKYLNKRIHKPNIEVTPKEKEKAFKETLGTNRIIIHKHSGCWDLDNILTNIRYMIKAYDCKYIFLDHITLLAVGDRDVNNRIHSIMEKLNEIVQGNEVTIFAISHINQDGNKPAEEGGAININRLYGSSGIKQVANTVLSFERDQRNEDETLEHQSKIRVLKDRFSGEATGKEFNLTFNTETGRLREMGVFDEGGEYND